MMLQAMAVRMADEITASSGNDAAKSHEKDRVTVETRFGTFEFDRSQAITFPKGIPGFAGYREFGLARLPNHGAAGFMLLQSLAPQDLSLIVTPYDPQFGLIESTDLEAARHHCGIGEDDWAAVLITALQQGPDGSFLTVNLRAPVVIDTANRLGWQYIFQNEAYEIRHRLEPVSA